VPLLNGESGGDPTERALHSRYDPVKEAEHYLANLNLPLHIRFFILLEPALGYIIPPIKRRFPGAEILSLHVSPFLAEKQEELNPGAKNWSPKICGLEDFLEREIPDVPAEQIRIVQWRPSSEAFGEAFLSLFRDTAAFIKRADANARTASFFGRRWIKNFFRNIKLIHKTVIYNSQNNRSFPWIVAGAGPSLENSITVAGRNPAAFVLAVSSAFPALSARGQKCDLALASDGGGWALFHLYELLRAANRSSPAPALAFSLSAALPSQCADLPLLPISDGSLWQRIVLEKLRIPFISLASRGTVTALAVDLALALGASAGPHGDQLTKIILTGTDLSASKLRSHARPYALDRFIESGASRLNPAYSAHFKRAKLLEGGGSFRVYEEWFKKQAALWPDRVFSLGANHPLFRSRELSEADLKSLKNDDDLEVPSPWAIVEKSEENFVSPQTAVDALCAALEGPKAAELCAELAPLLISGEEPLPAAVIREIRSLINLTPFESNMGLPPHAGQEKA
jgi:hypothetical protein